MFIRHELFNHIMGLCDFIRKYFPQEKCDVYCQKCGNQLTDFGGDVTDSGRIYCHGYEGVQTSCAIRALFNGQETGIAITNFYGPAKVQRAIRKRELTQFGRLEKSVEDN